MVPKKNNTLKINQYVVDDKDRKVAALINMKELDRLNKVLKLIPSSEVWLYENENALENGQKGLRDAAQGNISTSSKLTKAC